MFVDERHAAILGLLAEHGRVNAAELAERFRTTRETIRRDLNTLEESGRLRRVHGGAVTFEAVATRESPLRLRQSQNLGAKSRIGRAARRLITRGGVSVVVDAGSTTLQFAAALAEQPPGPEPLLVVTHSLPVAALLAEHPEAAKLELVGGQVRAITQTATGGETLRRFGELRADVAVLGTNAVTAGFGLSTPDPEEAAVKRAIVRAAKQVVVLCDAGKFQDPSLTRFAALDEIDVLITDAAPPADLAAELEAADVDVRVI